MYAVVCPLQKGNVERCVIRSFHHCACHKVHRPPCIYGHDCMCEQNIIRQHMTRYTVEYYSAICEHGWVLGHYIMQCKSNGEKQIPYDLTCGV